MLSSVSKFGGERKTVGSLGELIGDEIKTLDEGDWFIYDCLTPRLD